MLIQLDWFKGKWDNLDEGKTGFSGPKKSIPMTHQMANLTVFPIPIYFQNSVSEKSKKNVHLMPMKISLQTSVSEKKKHLAEGCTNDCCICPRLPRKISSGPSKRLEASDPWHPEPPAEGNLRLPILYPLIMSK